MNPTNPIPESPEILNQTGVSKTPNFKNSLILIMSILLIITVAIASLFYFQIQKLSKELSKYQAQASPTPTATADPTANWKTFIDNQKSFSLKYPNTWNSPTTNQLSTRTEYTFTPQNLSIAVGLYYNQDLQKPRTYEEEIAYAEKNAVGKRPIQVENQNITEYINYIGADLSTIEVSIILKGVKNDIIRISMPFPQGTDPSIFDQILSTFKFIETECQSGTVLKQCKLGPCCCPVGAICD